MTKWSELIKMETVPQDIIDFETEKCAKDTPYIFQYLQDECENKEVRGLELDINQIIDERAVLKLINNPDSFFRKAVNGFLRKSAFKGEVTGVYDYNKSHGKTDHDVPTMADYNDHNGSWVSIIRTGPSYSKYAVWSVDVQSIHSSMADDVRNFKGADVAFVHHYDTGNIDVFVPTEYMRKLRRDECYVLVGRVENCQFGNLFIKNDWKIEKV